MNPKKMGANDLSAHSLEDLHSCHVIPLEEVLPKPPA